MIRFDNFKEQYASIKEEIDSAIQRVLNSGWFILGKEVESFEEEFARYIGCKFAVSVASGTEAIALSLMALNVGPGDEVITSNMTAFPTIAAVLQAKAIPIVVDISPDDGLIDPKEIENKITMKTKAIMPVHLYGQSCNMDPIIDIGKRYNLRVIEDCAQSVGSTYKGRKTGNFGELNAFSFYPTKNLGAYGDGGAITTNDEILYKRLLGLRNYGQTDRYHHDSFGLNSRLDEMQAAVLRTKLKYLDEWNNKRHEAAVFYQNHIKNAVCLKENSYGVPVYHLFVIKTPHRDKLADFLKVNEIQSLIHYPVPTHRQKGFPFYSLQEDGLYPNTIRFAEEILSIPIYPELTPANRETIVRCIEEFRE